MDCTSVYSKCISWHHEYYLEWVSFQFDKKNIIDFTKWFVIVISSLIFSGFGVTELCWFSNKMALLVYFAVPFAGVMGLNIFLFVFSACMVYDSTKATSKMTTCGPRTNFHLYLRYEYLHFRDNYISRSADQTPNLTNPKFHFSHFNVLQSVFFFV